MKRLLYSTVLLACSAAPPLSAATLDPAAMFALSADDDYQKGTAALDQQQWQEAIGDFDRVIASHAQKADASLYWKAYALKKLGRGGLVQGTCAQLRGAYPASSWNRDCGALSLDGPSGTRVDADVSTQVTLRGVAPTNGEGASYGGGYSAYDTRSWHSESGAGTDADLKMLALNSVLRRDPAQALPAIRNILTSNGSPDLKHRALSVLAMSQSPDAQALLRDVATGKVAPTEQRQAISMLGVFQGKRASDTLAEVYRTTGDRNIKRSVISAFFISQDAPRMVELARNEKDLGLKHDIVAQLALMKDKAATDYMLELLK